ncbi:hypothetical protein [Sphaerisporangium album]|uniref:hypothetical protein n=1 Tax=Sphaerisporangium album TaxID=509200 RepID=UPI0011C0797D|nr:hypothetical protein [Sphaerisporangium album]
MDWNIFQTAGGRWWAINRRADHAHLTRNACVCVASLDADDLGGLTVLLAQQGACHPLVAA